MKNLSIYIVLTILLLSISQLSYAQAKRGEIQHDAEHYMLLPQHGEKWAQEDEAIAARLEEIRNANGGKPPNILFVPVSYTHLTLPTIYSL